MIKWIKSLFNKEPIGIKNKPIENLSLFPPELLRFETEVTLSDKTVVKVRLDKFKEAELKASCHNSLPKMMGLSYNNGNLAINVDNRNSEYFLKKAVMVLDECLINPKSPFDLFPFQIQEIFIALQSLYEHRMLMLMEVAFNIVGMTEAHRKRLKTLSKKLATGNPKKAPEFSSVKPIIDFAIELGMKPSEIVHMDDTEFALYAATKNAESLITLHNMDEQKRMAEIESRKTNVMNSGKLPTFSGQRR